MNSILDIQNNHFTCKVNQHISPTEITAYLAGSLVYIDGNGTSFQFIADDKQIKLHMIKQEGTYQYTTIVGSTNTIEKYKVRNIDKEKKGLLNYYLLMSYLDGVRQDVMKGYIDVSYSKECPHCEGSGMIKCSECSGTGQIENHKVSSDDEIQKEVEEVVLKKIKPYKERYEKKKARLGNTEGDALAIGKGKLKLEQQERRLREMTLDKIRNKKVKCPYCESGFILCPDHKYKTVTYKEEYSNICNSRKNKQ